MARTALTAQVPMSAISFLVIWPDHLTSTVTVQSDDKGYAKVHVQGSRDRLLNLFDYRTAKAVEAELRYVAQKAGAKVVRGESQ